MVYINDILEDIEELFIFEVDDSMIELINDEQWISNFIYLNQIYCLTDEGDIFLSNLIDKYLTTINSHARADLTVALGDNYRLRLHELLTERINKRINDGQRD